jgi:hypothetical protein
MMSILQIKAHNLQPALEWAEQNRSVLSQDDSPSSFEFRLHALNFLNVLSSQGALPALKYARQNFSAFKVLQCHVVTPLTQLDSKPACRV